MLGTTIGGGSSKPAGLPTFDGGTVKAGGVVVGVGALICTIVAGTTTGSGIAYVGIGFSLFTPEYGS